MYWYHKHRTWKSGTWCKYCNVHSTGFMCVCFKVDLFCTVTVTVILEIYLYWKNNAWNSCSVDYCFHLLCFCLSLIDTDPHSTHDTLFTVTLFLMCARLWWAVYCLHCLQTNLESHITQQAQSSYWSHTAFFITVFTLYFLHLSHAMDLLSNSISFCPQQARAGPSQVAPAPARSF
jgi:hypothetical protein